MSTLTAVFAILTAVIPWCKYYVLMIILFLVRGSARGAAKLSLSLMCATFCFYLFLEEAMVFFLTTFTLEHMHWTQSQGSYAATSYWAAFAIDTT
ncbi:uncharacterized protein LOC127705618 [Mytilus californianus]|uniref:uncharacterized protein LOC127705618 n=1 Tax=Mytilus californianus TaxID=6549 RepID=UPI002245225E|nr:uncharacterized protein LOC127705618 [Mytilus californianus]